MKKGFQKRSAFIHSFYSELWIFRTYTYGTQQESTLDRVPNTPGKTGKDGIMKLFKKNSFTEKSASH